MRSPRSRCSASQDQAPTSVPFQYNDDKAIVVLDPDDGDESALRLAYMWARWTVRRRLARRGAEDSTSSGSRGLLEDAARALERHTAIKRFHTQAKKSIDQAGEQVRDLVGEVRESSTPSTRAPRLIKLRGNFAELPAHGPTRLRGRDRTDGPPGRA